MNMKRFRLACALCLILVAGQARATSSTIPADPADSAIEISMMIGTVEALADICSPAPPSYEPALAAATEALEKLYGAAGLDPGQIPADIDQGRQDETRRHDDLSYPLNCTLFPKQVAAVEDHLIKARTQQAASSASSTDQ